MIGCGIYRGLKIMRNVFSRPVAGLAAGMVKLAPVPGDTNVFAMLTYVCCCCDIVTISLNTGPSVYSYTIDTL